MLTLRFIKATLSLGEQIVVLIEFSCGTVAALSGGECFMAPGQVNPLDLQKRPGLLETPLEHLAVRNTPAYNVTIDSDSGAVRIRRRRDLEMVVKAETYTDKDGRKHKFVNMVSVSSNSNCRYFITGCSFNVTLAVFEYLKALLKRYTYSSQVLFI